MTLIDSSALHSTDCDTEILFQNVEVVEHLVVVLKKVRFAKAGSVVATALDPRDLLLAFPLVDVDRVEQFAKFLEDAVALLERLEREVAHLLAAGDEQYLFLGFENLFARFNEARPV